MGLSDCGMMSYPVALIRIQQITSRISRNVCRGARLCAPTVGILLTRNSLN